MIFATPQSVQAAMLRAVGGVAPMQSPPPAPSLGEGLKGNAPKGAGVTIGVDEVPEQWQWIFGVKRRDLGQTVVIRIDGTIGYGSEAGWYASVRSEVIAGEINKVAEQARLAAATNSPAPTKLVLDINSPGGMVAGLADIAGALAAVRSAGVQTEALCHDTACSLGLMIALMCQRVLTTGTAIVGCLGTIITVEDWSAWYEKNGIKVEAIVSDGSEAKTDGAHWQALSDEARTRLTAQVNTLTAFAISQIAAVGGRDEAAVRALFDGTTYAGADAVAWARGQIAGVVDPQAYFDALGRGQDVQIASAVALDVEMSDTPSEQEPAMADAKKNDTNVAATIGQIKAAMGERFDNAVAVGYLEKGLTEAQVLEAEGKRGGDLLKQAEAKASAAEAKVAELTAELAKATAANAELTAKAEAMGKQVDELKAKAEAAGMKLDVLGNKVVKAVAPVATGAGGKPAGGAGGVGGVGNDSAVAFEEAVEAHMASAKCNRQVAVFAMSTKHPAAFAEWQKARKG